MEEILETLKIIGLTEGEAKVYMALLALGSSTVGHIIEKSGISASKVYNVLDRLINKGLASMIVQDKNKVFSATTTEKILDYLDEEKQKIEKNKENAKKIIPLLNITKESAITKPVVELSKGRKGAEAFYDEVYDSIKPGDNYLATSGKRISIALQNYWFKQSKILSEKKVPQYLAYEYLMWNKKDPNVHKRTERKDYYPRVLDKKYTDLPTIVIIGNKTVISDLDDEGKLFTLLIRNKNMTDSFRKLLEIVRDSGTVPTGFK